MKFFNLSPFLMMTPSGEGGGGTGMGTGVIDSPAPDTSSDDVLDTGADTTLEADTGADSTDTTEAPAGGEGFKGRAIENGKINPGAKPILDQIRAQAPALEKQIRNALIRTDVLNREFPGGIQAIRSKIGALEAQLNEFGGPDGVKKLQTDLNDMNEMVDSYVKGSPDFIEYLTEDANCTNSFIKLGPAIIEKYASLHPEGFDSYIAGKMKSEFESTGFKANLVEMKFFLDRLPDSPEKQEIVARWDGIVGDGEGKYGLFNRTMNRAAKKTELPKIEGAQPKQDDGREQQLTQREAQIKQQEYGLTWSQELTGVVGPELARLRTERGFNGNTEAAIKELFASRFDKIVKAKGQQATKFFKAGNKAEYQKAIRQLFREEAPRTLASVVDHFAPAKAGKKPAPVNGTGKPAVPGQKPAPAAETGFLPVRTKPAMTEIDFDKTRALGLNAYNEGKAVLKDGRRVKFAR